MLEDRHFNRIKHHWNDTGYCGHYGFSKADATKIKDNASSKGLGFYETCGYFLVIDLDDGDATYQQVSNLLIEKGIGHEIWFSGGKGYHIILYHDLICDSRLPYSHKVWVEQEGIQCDLSLYQSGRIISLPGRLHPKTGKKKKLIKVIEGDDITVELKEIPFTRYNEVDRVEEPQKVLVQGLTKCLGLAMSEPALGNRHTSLWSTSKMLLQSGLEPSSVADIIYTINSHWENPKTDEEIQLIIQQATKE